MDNNSSGQGPNQNQPPTQTNINTPSAVIQGPVQDILQSTPQPNAGQPLAENPVQSGPSSKITLEDLYGPSQVQQDLPQSSVSTNKQIPDLPQIPMQPQSTTQKMEPPVLENPVQPTDVKEAVSLRRDDISEESTSSIPHPQYVSDKSLPSQEVPPDKPGGINRLFLLRIILGAVGVVLFIVILMFVVTFISSILHPGSSGKTSITFWGLWEDSNTMQVVISAFERQHPDISVSYEKEDPKQYSQRLLTRIQQGNGPDVFIYHSSWLPMVKSVLVPLPTSVINKSELQNNFYPVVGNDLIKNGALYGIPLEVDTLSLFVNNSLLKSANSQVPTTWDNFATISRSLTQKDTNGRIKIAGAAMGSFDNITHAPDILSALFVQNGVNITTLSPKSNASDALSFYTSFATGDSKVWDSTLDPSQLAFIKGNLAMYFGYSWDIFAIKATSPSLDFAIYPIPHLPGRNTTAASYWVQGVSNKSLHQKESFLFMNFLAQRNTEALLFAEESKTRLFGEPYARQDLGVTLKNNPLVYPFVSQATSATSSFFAGETQDSGINAQMNGYLGNAVRSVLNNTSPDSAVDTLLQGVQQVENQYGP